MVILQSKLQTPKRYNTLHRERLVERFVNINKYKLIAVTAGAGYGKTTLVIDAMEALDVISIWYLLDRQDNDFFVFISYLYAAVQHHFSDSTENNSPNTIPKKKLQKHTDTLIEWLAFLEKRVKHDCVLILDDYHLVQDNSKINHAVEFIIDRLPDHIQMVIIGRRRLPLRLSSLCAKEQLIEIGEKNLSFTSSEIKRFFSGTLLQTDSYIEDICSSTGGWAASLVLLRYTFHKKTPEAITNCLELFKQTPRYIFSYLEENIFDPQPERIKNFMMKAALLDRIDIHTCRKFFNVNDAGSIIKKMIADHLMIFPVDESETIFYLHHLFKEFLISQLKKTFSESEIHHLHCTIAREVENEDVFQAMDHFIEGNAFNEAIRLIESHEMEFLLEGKTIFLERCLKKIPPSIIEQNPQLLLAQAKLLTYFGNPGKAVEILIRAHQLFNRQASKQDMVKCLIELGSQYYFTGYVKEAKLLMEQVIDQVEKPSTTYSIAMTYLTFLSSVLGEFETAKKYYKIFFEVIEQLPDLERKISRALINTSHTYTLYINGNFEQAQLENKKLLKSVLALNIDPCLPLVYYQLSATCFFLGTFNEGIAFARKGIETCEKISLSDSRKGWNFLAWAQNCMGLGKLDQAIELIDNSIELFEDPGNRWGMANAWECLCQVYMIQGKIQSARQILNRAMEIIDGYGLILTEGILGNSHAALLMIEQKFSQALACLKNAGEKLDGATFHRFNNHLLTANVYIKMGNSSEAITQLSCALLLSEANRYEQFVKKEIKWLLPFLKDILPQNTIFRDKIGCYVKTLFEKELEKEPPQLKITLLGKFNVTMDDQKLPLSRWKSSKALMIFKYLAANRHKGFIPREVLIELLWPEEDIQKTGSRFNVAMSSLRKTLEPQLSPKSASAYIERKKDQYRLCQGARICIDTEDFSNTILAVKTKKDTPHKKLGTLLSAQSLYQGAFLEENPYEEWCIVKREWFTAGYLKILWEIVSLYQREKQIEKAIFFTRKILATEPFDENAYKQLMSFYAQSGRLSKTQEIYLIYKKMAAQMDCPVRSDITKLYCKLFQKSNSI
ncbi:ATP-, maltotriose-and DNA-dependent transcriptional regulator MalT [Desulfocicer vacuolatum DSM 3385]|uniref:ATP-, maltotriose-and DNA-dependent transcriptional regulator MalT n=1 Tax=Desulfocicer vacuolatum DSM 3385 TaxID=1121400 RepID=A0A1W2EMH9_9BACT|nr:BTAD domain-containing putative transcriptional regulator [Desulfocicer vacuolatum]SMD10348.1 ATP-, maltotriose-and DNA-dependent transcriptional regulator MalT [Desulfocicer vacuolatum DSM 3385]